MLDSAGRLTVTPHGIASLPLPASLVSSLSAMTDFRLVMPVTTASGKVGGLVAVGLGVGVGETDGVAVGEGEGVGVGVGPGPRQPAKNTAAATSVLPRGRRG